MTDFEWDQHPDVQMARANYMGCAYNAAVNSDQPRGIRKMGDLIRAINLYERTLGTVKLDLLVEKGVIDGYENCGADCMVRPGGLFHGDDCSNNFNHPTYKARQQRAMEKLPGGSDGRAGWRAAYVHLVGPPSPS